MAPLKLYKSKQKLFFRKTNSRHMMTIRTFEIECGIFLLLENFDNIQKNNYWGHFKSVQKFYHIKSKQILFATWYPSEDIKGYFIEIEQ